MMTNKSFIEDMITLGSGVLNNFVDVRHELKAQARQRASSIVRSLDLVSREEFDGAFAMLAKARNMQEDLASRMLQIEAHLNLANKHKASDKKKVKIKKKSLPSVKTKRAVRKRK